MGNGAPHLARVTIRDDEPRDASRRRLLLARGDMTAEAYVSRLLNQHEAHKTLNVVAAIDPARVLEAARAVDRSRARGARLGPAAGLPFAVKDQIAVAGYPASGGTAALKGYVPKRSATVVDRLIAAGAIPFCKTTLPDMNVVDGLMHQISAHSDAFGAVRNPYDATRIPGGSSGGSGAILAARIVPAALGLDTNGSIRCPSAFCGVAGLRPSTWTMDNAINGTSRKRYPDDGLVIPPARRLDTIGPMARTVSDVAFLDGIITGSVVRAIAYPTIPIVAPRLRSGGPKEPLGEMMTIKGKAIEEGRAVAQNIFMAPRFGAAALSVPVGLSEGLPVGLQLDALPGNDSELLAVGIAVQEIVGRIPPPSL